MAKHDLTLHETMEIHELLNFKTLSMTKAKMMQGLVFDQDLKKLMELEVKESVIAVGQLQGLLSKSPTLQ